MGTEGMAQPSAKDGYEAGNIYGGIMANGNHEDNNRRSTVNPAAQNPNEFRVSDYKAYGSTNKAEDPIGRPFTPAKEAK